MLQYPWDRVFHALADPTRLAIVEALMRGPKSVGELHAPFAVSLAAVGQHVQLLETTGLVRSEKIGRTRVVRLEPARLLEVERWFSNHRARWESRFDALGCLLAEEESSPREKREGKRK